MRQKRWHRLSFYTLIVSWHCRYISTLQINVLQTRRAVIELHRYHNRKSPTSNCQYKGPKVFFIGTLFVPLQDWSARYRENKWYSRRSTFSYPAPRIYIYTTKPKRALLHFSDNKKMSPPPSLLRIVHIQHPRAPGVARPQKQRVIVSQPHRDTFYLFRSLYGTWRQCISLHTRLISLIWHASNNKRRSF